MNIETGKTPTEQDYISFKNKHNEKITLVAGEESLRCAIREDGDVSMHAPFTHFTRDEVKAILPYLQAYVETGTFDLSKQEPCSQTAFSINRDQLGELVRLAWVEWAHEQPDPKPSWLVPWAGLSETDKEADRRIGEFIANVLDKNHHPLDIYQQEVQRTVGTKGFNDTIAMTSMGLAGEVGETIDALKKCLWHGHSFDKDAFEKEVGDVMWYLVAMCNALNVSLKDVLDKNVEKLQKRYPSGFDAERSKNREDH